MRDLIDDFGAISPTPAAGAAAALSLSHGAAIGLKAVRISMRHDPSRTQSLASAERKLISIARQGAVKFDEDCQAVQALMADRRIQRESDRRGGVDDAIGVPSEILALSLEGLQTLAGVVGRVRQALICEVGASASLMWAAAETSHWIVRNNAAWLGDSRKRSGIVNDGDQAKEASKRFYDDVSAAVDRVLAD